MNRSDNGAVRFAKRHVRPKVIALFRAYIRHFPVDAGKPLLWKWVAQPWLDGAPYPFLARTRFGMRVAGDTQDIIQAYIYYFGLWQPNLTRWIGRRLRPGDVFVDVGANIGYFSLYASSLVGDGGSVVAVEASPGIFKRLEETLALNGLGNVRAVNIAASDEDSVVKVYRAPAANIGMTTIVRDRLKRGEYECEVKAAGLGQILSEDELRRARIIKVDVEGAEWGVAKGLVPLLNRCRNDVEIVMEVSLGLGSAEERQGQAIIEMFKAAGFHAYSLDNDYSALSYLRRAAVKHPMRLHGPIETQTDVVFSRHDTERL